jgi:DNA-binding response OmpR family regulator
MKLLLVEDDELLVQMLSSNLRAQRYTVDSVMDGEAGWDFAQAATYDLIVLDVNLPKLSGIHLCQKLRQIGYSQPILMLTAQGDDANKIIGLDAGADDYVVKPCSVDELCARIRALLRRQSASSTPVLEWAALRLDPSRCEVTYGDQLVLLSSKEYSLLELFLRHSQQIFSSRSILDHLWGYEEPPGEEAVRTLVKRLRHKLKSAGAEDVIDTVYGIGYRLKPLITSQSSTAALARASAIAAWEQFKGPVLERLAVVDQAVAAIQTGCLSEALRSEAEQAAHKLSGSLGMFGFPEGSRLGQEIEHWLQTSDEVKEFTQLKLIVTKLRRELQQPPKLLNHQDQPVNSEMTLRSQVQPLSLLVIDDDEGLTDQLQAVGRNCGIQIDVATSVSEARSMIVQHLPDTVLLNLSFPDAPHEGSLLLEDLTAQFPNLPVLIFTANDRLSDRLELARHGKHRFISKTTPTLKVLEIVRETVERTRPAEIRVLAVDDDLLTLSALQRFLSHLDICLFTLDDPQKFWETLETTTPDLLILDLEMPGINGIELCQVVRSDHTWDRLSILILTACKDAATIQQLFSAGADDYIAKPFTESEMISHICTRLQRNRLLSVPSR